MRQITKGATDQSVIVRVVDSVDGTPETGVAYNTAGVDLWYRREGGLRVAITEATLATVDAAHSDGGFIHISDGYCRLDLPDAAVASGADGVMVGGTFTGMVVIGAYHELVDAKQTGDSYARLGAPAGASIAADLAAIEAQTDDIGVAGAGLTAIPWNAAWDAEVQSECADALTAYDPPTHAELVSEIDAVQTDIAALNDPTAAAIADAVWDEARAGHVAAGSFGEGVSSVQGNVTGSVASVTAAVTADTVTDKTGYSLSAAQTFDLTGDITGNLSGSVGSVTGAVGSVTGNVGGNVTGSVGSVAAGGITAPSFGAGAIDAAALATDAGQEIADRILARNIGGGSDGGRTVLQALQILRNKVTIAGGTMTVTAQDDTTSSWTATITTTAGDPVSGVDPA